jgi:Uma2 family endonuclease
MATNVKVQPPWGQYVPWVGTMTVEQLERFPTQEGWIYELHEGRLIVVPGPGADHADIQERFFLTLGVYLRASGLGHLSGTGCYNLPLPTNTEELLCPDLSYVEPARRATMPKRGSYLVGAPDLVIEIASPSDTPAQMAAKVAIYLAAGVRLVWVAWPTSRTVDVWRPSSPQQPTALGSADMLNGLDVVPGFRCPVADLFAL